MEREQRRAEEEAAGFLDLVTGLLTQPAPAPPLSNHTDELSTSPTARLTSPRQPSPHQAIVNPLPTLLNNVSFQAFQELCRKNGIILNPKKFTLVAQQVSFCGYVLSEEDIAPDAEKIGVIAA